MHRLLAAAAVIVLTACGRTPTVDIVLVTSPAPSAIEIRGLPRRDIAALAAAKLTQDDWQRILRVQVATPGAEPVVGAYTAVDGAIRFVPMYGFDAGRSFSVTFDASRVPGADHGDSWRSKPVVANVGLPAAPSERTTRVRQVYPSAAEIPANLLRIYIDFSGPMGRGNALEHIRLLDESGAEVIAPFLPVEAELWTADRTRFTLLFDPGRVKRGIKPNLDMGRALLEGRRYTLVIDDKWRDGSGQPLVEAHRHEFRVGPPLEKALDHSRWELSAPAADTRNPLVVHFPWPLDHGLLERALGVRRNAAEIAGEITIGPGETQWTFTPTEKWKAGEYSLMALTLLEDPAGNRLGRAFEVRDETAPQGEAVYRVFNVALSTPH
jgi:hypothetical protein